MGFRGNANPLDPVCTREIMGLTLFEKLWQEHLVESQDDGTDLVYIDRIFLHERTGSIAMSSLQADGREVFYPQQVFCCMDHIVDTFPGRSLHGDTIVAPDDGAAHLLKAFDKTNVALKRILA